jgi:hypothetical protein
MCRDDRAGSPGDCAAFSGVPQFPNRCSHRISAKPTRSERARTSGLLQVRRMNEKVKSGTLVRLVAVRNPSALAKLLNQLKPVPKDAVYPCPFDSGSRDALVFVKANKSTTVLIPTSGCPFVSSTKTSGRWFLSKAANAALQKLDPALRP